MCLRPIRERKFYMKSNKRIYQPSKVIFTSASALGKYNFFGLINPYVNLIEVNKCILLNVFFQCKLNGTIYWVYNNCLYLSSFFFS